MAAKHPEAETTPKLLVDKQSALRTATNQVQAAGQVLATAQTRLRELTQQIKLLTQSVNSSAAKVQTTKVAAADSTRQLAADKDRVEKLAAEYRRLKSAPDGSLAEAGR